MGTTKMNRRVLAVAASAALLVTALAVPAAAADKGDTSTWQSLYFSVEAGNIYGDRITVRADGGTDWTGADYAYASVEVAWDEGDIICYVDDVDSDAQIEWGNKSVSLFWDSPVWPRGFGVATGDEVGEQQPSRDR